jgi:hypothetical protein
MSAAQATPSDMCVVVVGVVSVDVNALNHMVTLDVGDVNVNIFTVRTF